MRLIDANALIEEIKPLKIVLNGKSILNDDAKDTILKVIDEQPTSYDIDKVVEEMENEIKLYENSQSIMGCNDADIEYYGAMKGLGKAIEIVKQHKYNF